MVIVAARSSQPVDARGLSALFLLVPTAPILTFQEFMPELAETLGGSKARSAPFPTTSPGTAAARRRAERKSAAWLKCPLTNLRDKRYKKDAAASAKSAAQNISNEVNRNKRRMTRLSLLRIPSHPVHAPTRPTRQQGQTVHNAWLDVVVYQHKHIQSNVKNDAPSIGLVRFLCFLGRTIGKVICTDVHFIHKLAQNT